MSSPRVTVVIPCFDLGAYLDQAVQSVLDQTFADCEIVVVDDGSTDEATRLLFASYQRPRTRVVRTPNRGLAAARNLGLELARGEYVVFLDADDLLEPTYLEQAVARLDADRELAFVSCWLRGFGALEFDWRPADCAPPRLLVECTFCTASMLRRDIVREIGGFDAAMPLAGYEDWDLALTLAERGHRGVVLPETLFRYRIRLDSMSATCTAPTNHARLVEYLVDKHAAIYRRDLGGALAAIDDRIREHESHPILPTEEGGGGRSSAAIEGAFRERALVAALGSSSWRATAGLRGFAKRLFFLRSPRPELTVVVAAGVDAGRLARTVESVFREGSAAEIVVVDQRIGGTAVATVVEAATVAGARSVAAPGARYPAALAAGLAAARAPFATVLVAGQEIAPGSFARAISALEQRPAPGFAVVGLLDRRTGFRWQAAGAGAAELLGSARLAFPIAPLGAWRSVASTASAELPPERVAVTLAARLARGGAGVVIDATVETDGPLGDVAGEPPSPTAGFEHADVRADWRAILLARENQRRRLEAQIEQIAQPAARTAPAEVDFGSFATPEPVSRVWGLDRGTPIDRVYIERFLERHRQAIHGRVLEVKDAGYTRRFGQLVAQSDVVDLSPDNDEATLIADLTEAGALPADAYDCIVLTQTLHVVYDVRAVLESLWRALKPGGVLLSTLPSVSRLDYESGLDGDFWRFTPASARRLFEERFGVGRVNVEAAGNVLACTAFLQGLAASDLRPEQLDRDDAYFPLLIGVRCEKESSAASSPATLGSRASVLVYHRVATARRDRWQLAIEPERFEAQIRRLATSRPILRLTELADALREGTLPDGAVAVTFDDGYRDLLTTALPILGRYGVPATLFVTTGGIDRGEPYWWDELEAAELEDAALDAMQQRLMVLPVAERRRVLDSLPRGAEELPMRLSVAELLELASDPLIDLGAHGVTHRIFRDLDPAEQEHEIGASIEWLRGLGAGPIRSFAYPIGYTSPEAPRIARAHGLDIVCRIAKTCVFAATHPLSIPRFAVEGWPEDELERRLGALAP